MLSSLETSYNKIDIIYVAFTKGGTCLRKFSLFVMVIGLAIIGYAGYQIFDSNMSQKSGLAAAKELIGLNENDNESNEVRKYSDKSEFKPGQGDVTGLLTIPRLEAELPIFEGTHEDELSQGVGHYDGTAYPLDEDQIVLSGHRDTVFRRMGELEIGDIMTMNLEYGDFDYEIVDMYIVDADDRTVIVPRDEEVLTVTTCYPFSFVGSAPDRYIIDAVPVGKKTHSITE